MKKTTLLTLLALGLGSVLARPVAAQHEAKVYDAVEQMPALPGGNGMTVIREAIFERLSCPPEVTRTRLMGTVVVRFVVTEKGEVASVEVLQKLVPSADAAVMAAVRKLPRFSPGKQNGRAVRVYETVPVWLNCSAGPVPARPLPDASAGEAYPNDSSKVYTYIEQEPMLPGGGGVAAIVAAVQKRLVLPPDTPSGRVFVRFTVGPRGSVYNATISKPLSATADAAALAAVRQLPRFVPGRQNGRVVAFSFTIPVAIGLAAPASPK